MRQEWERLEAAGPPPELHGGYVWAATAWMYGLPVVGFDRLSSDTGQMRWRLLTVRLS